MTLTLPEENDRLKAILDKHGMLYLVNSSSESGVSIPYSNQLTFAARFLFSEAYFVVVMLYMPRDESRQKKEIV